ncbi:methyltransferase domain-containing protein [Pendulispora albinea]|uniref:Class I SAM-dependent methyltransferase n=1 Tax=Pendulispora albinea TaxID=2741071 RepID=A0ABZ2LXN1_9BACT
MSSPKSNSIDRVTTAWKEHWEKSDVRPDASWKGSLLRRYVARFGGFSSNRYILHNVLLKHLNDVRGKSVLDAGAGTGLNSLPLSLRGADVTLLDIAPRALEIASTYYAELGLTARCVPGSIFEMPFPDRSFDIVWNTGVIEHFEPVDRRRALHEMLRVMKPSGVLLTVNPNANARIYRFAKERAERSGTWDVGVEYPIAGLAPDVDHQKYELLEEEAGFLMQLHFLKYLLPKALRFPYVALHEGVQSLVNNLNRYPGYLRVSVIRQRAPG